MILTDEAKVRGARDGVGLVDSSTFTVTERTVAVYIHEDSLMTTYSKVEVTDLCQGQS
jgi:hypothetical protein